MTTLVNINTTTIPRSNLIYIGRTRRYGNTQFGNPFRIGGYTTRAEAIRKYKSHLLASPTLQHKIEGLRGKILACHCAPRECHGDVIIDFINGKLEPNATASRGNGKDVEKRGKAYKHKVKIASSLVSYLAPISDVQVVSDRLVIPSWLRNKRFFGRPIISQARSLFPRGVPIGLSRPLLPVLDEEGVCPGTERTEQVRSASTASSATVLGILSGKGSTQVNTVPSMEQMDGFRRHFDLAVGTETLLQSANLERHRKLTVPASAEDIGIGSGLKRVLSKNGVTGVSKKQVFYLEPIPGFPRVDFFGDSMVRTVAEGSVVANRGCSFLSVPGARFSHLQREMEDKLGYQPGTQADCIVLLVGTNECERFDRGVFINELSSLLDYCATIGKGIPVVLVGALPRLDKYNCVVGHINETMHDVCVKLSTSDHPISFVDFGAFFPTSDMFLWAKGDRVHLCDAVGTPRLIKCILDFVKKILKSSEKVRLPVLDNFGGSQGDFQLGNFSKKPSCQEVVCTAHSFSGGDEYSRVPSTCNCVLCDIPGTSIRVDQDTFDGHVEAYSVSQYRRQNSNGPSFVSVNRYEALFLDHKVKEVVADSSPTTSSTLSSPMFLGSDFPSLSGDWSSVDHTMVQDKLQHENDMYSDVVRGVGGDDVVLGGGDGVLGAGVGGVVGVVGVVLGGRSGGGRRRRRRGAATAGGGGDVGVDGGSGDVGRGGDVGRADDGHGRDVGRVRGGHGRGAGCGFGGSGSRGDGDARGRGDGSGCRGRARARARGDDGHGRDVGRGRGGHGRGAGCGSRGDGDARGRDDGCGSGCRGRGCAGGGDGICGKDSGNGGSDDGGDNGGNDDNSGNNRDSGDSPTESTSQSCHEIRNCMLNSRGSIRHRQNTNGQYKQLPDSLVSLKNSLVESHGRLVGGGSPDPVVPINASHRDTCQANTKSKCVKLGLTKKCRNLPPKKSKDKIETFPRTLFDEILENSPGVTFVNYRSDVTPNTDAKNNFRFTLKKEAKITYSVNNTEYDIDLGRLDKLRKFPHAKTRTSEENTEENSAKEIDLHRSIPFVPITEAWQIRTCSVFGLTLWKIVQVSSAEIAGVPSRTKAIKADGNCFYRAISFFVSGTEVHHQMIRAFLLQHMLTNEEMARELFLIEDMKLYVDRQSLNAWAGECEIFMMAHLLKTDICVYSNNGWQVHSGQFLDPTLETSSQKIYINHPDNNHYEVVLSTSQNVLQPPNNTTSTECGDCINVERVLPEDEVNVSEIDISKTTRGTCFTGSSVRDTREASKLISEVELLKKLEKSSQVEFVEFISDIDDISVDEHYVYRNTSKAKVVYKLKNKTEKIVADLADVLRGKFDSNEQTNQNLTNETLPKQTAVIPNLIKINDVNEEGVHCKNSSTSVKSEACEEVVENEVRSANIVHQNRNTLTENDDAMDVENDDNHLSDRKLSEREIDFVVDIGVPEEKVDIVKRNEPKKKKKKCFRGISNHDVCHDDKSISKEDLLIVFKEKPLLEFIEFVSDIDQTISNDGPFRYRNNREAKVVYSIKGQMERGVSQLGDVLRGKFGKVEQVQKVITKEMLLELATSIPNSIRINAVNVEGAPSSDLSSHLNGPWYYNDSVKVSVIYTVDNKKLITMRLDNILRRGFVIDNDNYQCQYYSFITFKNLVKSANIYDNDNISFVDFARSLSEADFKKYVLATHEYYRKHPQNVENEGIEDDCGPQNYEDRNTQNLLYYGKNGKYKYYRFQLFLQGFIEKFGQTIATKDFLAKPLKSGIPSEDIEQLLIDVNAHISKRSSEQNRNKLIHFAGPQCYEDCVNIDRLTYGAGTSFRPEKLTTNQASTTSGNKNMTETISKSKFAIRVCETCQNLRVLGHRAASKYPLGYYKYNGQRMRFQFHCDLLHKVHCSTPPDLVEVQHVEHLNEIFQVNEVVVAYFKDNQNYIAFSFEIQSLLKDHVIVKFMNFSGPNHHPYKDKRPMCLKKVKGTHFKFASILEDGQIKTDTTVKEKFYISKCEPELREAINCTTYYDSHLQNQGIDINDADCEIRFELLNRTKQIHSVLNSAKDFQCLKCNRQCPTLESISTIKTPVGQKYENIDDLLQEVLEESKTLSAVHNTPSSIYTNSSIYSSTPISISSICTDCAPSYKIDENDEVVPKYTPAYNDVIFSSQSTNSEDSQDLIDDDIELSQGFDELMLNEEEMEPRDLTDNSFSINKWSKENLFTTALFHDERYEALIRQMSLAERLLMTSFHICCYVHRTTASNIPKLRGSTIAFMLTEPLRTKTVPWPDFTSLPFVQVECDRRDADQVMELRVNIELIKQIFDIWNRDMTCPVLGTRRKFQRLLGNGIEISESNMIALQEQLELTKLRQNDGTTVDIYTPKNIPSVKQTEIEERSKQPLNFQCFDNFLKTHGRIATALREYSMCDVRSDDDATSQTFWGEICCGVLIFLEEEFNEIKVGLEEDDERFDEKIKHFEHIIAQVKAKQAINMSHFVQYLVNRKILTDDSRYGDTESLAYLIAEEMSLVEYLSSNDRGKYQVPKAVVDNNRQRTDPEEFMDANLANTKLGKLREEHDYEHPVNEWSKSFFPLSFPFIFKTGDADPFQERPVKINQGEWKEVYLHQLALLGRGSYYYQFVILSLKKKVQAYTGAKLISMRADFNKMPSAEELRNDKKLCDEFCTYVKQFSPRIVGSNSSWKCITHNKIGVQRHMTHCLSDDQRPYIPTALFRTIALPYRDAPYFHRLITDESSMSQNLIRAFNATNEPVTIEVIGTLLQEMNINYYSPYLCEGIESDYRKEGGYYYSTRYENGGNGNPHWHTLSNSTRLGNVVKDLNVQLEAFFANEITKYEKWTPDAKDALNKAVKDEWKRLRMQLFNYFGGMYTNWNPCFTSKKEETAKFEKINTATLCMDNLINDALSTGQFRELDRLYLNLIWFSNRHINHTGTDGLPGKDDYCARKKKVLVQPEGGEQYYDVTLTCKRRKPQPERAAPAIYRDPHDQKFTQISSECNDGMMNGVVSTEVFLVVGNTDSKGVPPAPYEKPPTIEFVEGAPPILEYYISTGNPTVEYMFKYVHKGPVPPKTDTQLLASLNDTVQGKKGGMDFNDLYSVYVRIACEQEAALYEAVHMNLELPLVMSNSECTGISVSGNKTLTSRYSKDTELFNLNHVDKFNERISTDSKDPTLQARYQQRMSMHNFFENFDVVKDRNAKQKEDGSEALRIKERKRFSTKNDYKAIALRPHFSFNYADPKDPYKYPFYSKSLCNFFIPHDTIEEKTFDDVEEERAYWKEKFEETFPSGKDLPDVFKGFIQHFLNKNSKEEEDDDDDEDTRTLREKLKTRCRKQDIEVSEPEVQKKKDKSSTYQSKDDKLLSRGLGPCYAEQASGLDGNERNEYIRKLETNYNAGRDANPGREDLKRWAGGFVPLDNPKLKDICERKYTAMMNAAPRLDSCESDRKRTLNDKQQAAKELIIEWFTNHDPNKPGLRLFVSGIPGGGKTATFKSMMAELLHGGNFKIEQSRVACPTGCTSYNMGYSAQTLHRVFQIQVGRVGEPIAGDVLDEKIKFLKEHLGAGELVFLFFDECSMISREIFEAMIIRLEEAGIDLDKLGMVFFGDPAQNEPVTGLPMWFTGTKTNNKKPCSKLSIDGMATFRRIMRMLPRHKVPGFKDMKSNNKNIRRLGRRKFLRNMYKGDWHAIFLDKNNRLDNTKESKQFNNVLGNCRYGNATAEDMRLLKSLTATAEDVENNPELWKNKTVLTDYHYFSEIEEERSNTEYKNARELHSFNIENNQYAVRFDAINTTDAAAKQSPSQFASIPNKLYLGIGAPVMLTTNVKSPVGLYNGASGTFRGALYIPEVYVLKGDVIRNIKIGEDGTFQQQLPLYVNTGKNPETQKPEHKTVIFPKGTMVKELLVDGIEADFKTLDFDDVRCGADLAATIEIPTEPPFLPNFLVIDIPEYSGPTFFDANDKEIDLRKHVLIRTVKRARKDANIHYNKDKVIDERIGFPVELRFSKTAFKGIGDNQECTQAEVLGMSHRNGVLLVAFSRNSNPKRLHIPDEHFPHQYHFLQLRMKESVIESECLEREMRIKCAQLFRLKKFDIIRKNKYFNKYCIAENDSLQFNTIANTIAQFLEQNGPFNLDSQPKMKAYIDKLYESDPTYEKEQYKGIHNFMMKTDEKFLNMMAPELSDTDRKNIQDYFRQRKKEKRNGKTTADCDNASDVKGATKNTKKKTLKRKLQTKSTPPIPIDLASPINKKRKIGKSAQDNFTQHHINVQPESQVITQNAGVGFRNTDGVTCYINSVLQALFAIPNDTLFCSVPSILYHTLAHHVKVKQDLYNITLPGMVLKNNEIYNTLYTLHPADFSCGQQADAAEFLDHLITSVERSNEECLHFEAEQINFLKCNIITTLSSPCHHQPSITTAPVYTFLTLPLPHIDVPLTWDHLLFRKEMVKYRCERVIDPNTEEECNIVGNIEKTIEYEFLSEYIFLRLRLTELRDNTQNETTYKRIPNLRLEDRILNQNNTYIVQAVISHMGNTVHSGHFICKRRIGNTNKWIKFNDQVVTQYEDQHILHVSPAAAYQPYIILLKRI